MGLACAVEAQTDDASRGAARDLATAGVEAFQREAFVDANTKLDKAYRVLRVPSIGLWSARALVKVGQFVKASERYREVVWLEVAEGDAAVQKRARADAASELEALTPRIPRVVIKLAGAAPEDVSIKVDGAPVSSELVGESRPIDPGRHVIEATRAAQTVNAEVVVGEGETRDAFLRFEAARPVAAAPVAPAAAPLPLDGPNQLHGGMGTGRALGLVTIGVGVVSVAVGSVFGLRAKSKLDEANRGGCTGQSCPTQASLDANDTARTSGNISTVAFIVGAAGLAGGALLWFSSGPESAQKASVGVGPGSLQLRTVW